MRDIKLVLERWGAWVADNPCDVYYSPIAAGFKGLIPSRIRSRQQCCDADGLIISKCMALLNNKSQDDHDLLFEYYGVGKNVMQLSNMLGCSDTHVGKRLHKAEGIIDGMLMMLNIGLEMDSSVMKEMVRSSAKKCLRS